MRPRRRPLERKYTRPREVISPYTGRPPRLLLPKFMVAIFLAIGLTALGTAVYILYDSRIELSRIECDVKEMLVERHYTVNVTCFDFKDRPLKDVRVHIAGASIDETKISDENGRAQFDVVPLLPTNVHNDIVRITAYHPAKPEIVCNAFIPVHD
ncbi:MAG: hypothetical protein QXJ27_00885 [Thermoplasmata archaeon]